MIKLKNVVINKYKSFLEKQEIEIEDGVTRIVGKNESGKTALLEAMAKFNYFDPKDKTFTFNSTNDYPRGELKRYQQEYSNEDFDVITCTFELSDDLLNQISEDVGKDVFTSKSIIVAKTYNNSKKFYNISINIKNFIKQFLQNYTIEENMMQELIKSNSLEELVEKLKEIEELTEVYKELKTKYIDSFKTDNENRLASYILSKYIEPNLPEFLYFDEYYSLPGTINLQKLNYQILI